MKTMDWIFTTLLLLAALPGLAQKLPPKDEAQIRAILASQTQAWNNGDLPNFMKGYWESDSLKFVGTNGITHGWQATLQRYQRSYPDRAAMGILTFDILHVQKISRKSALVIGHWHLQRQNDTPQGHFTLLWQKHRRNWHIILDHSS